MQKEVYEFISQKTNDLILEWRTCAVSGKDFAIFQSDKEFYEKISPSFGGKKYLIPFPTLCPEERARRRMAWRNERSFYKATCAVSGRSLISIISPDSGYTIYSPEFWLSDDYDFSLYAQEPHFSISFFQQFSQLHKAVPKRNIVVGGWSENCDYVNGVGGSKDCYMIFETSNADHCYFSNSVNSSSYCVDCYFTEESEQCYECIYCLHCNACQYGYECINCAESYRLSHCQNCKNCIASTNIDNQQYCIFNKQYTKEQYYEENGSVLGDRTWIEQRLLQHTSYPSLKMEWCEGCIGNRIYYSSNAICSHEVRDVQDVRYATLLINYAKDCRDIDGVGNHITRVYESAVVNKFCDNILFSFDTRNNCRDLQYCVSCKKCEQCFMCHGLIGKAYCILNKQYTKKQYETLIPRIIDKMMQDEEWGEFFPIVLSPFAYTDTVAHSNLPLTDQEIIERWYTSQIKKVETSWLHMTIHWNDLPISINEVHDDILNKVIICKVSWKPYRIIKQELDFYRKHQISLPGKHPDIRHKERLEKRPQRNLYLRACDKTWEKILSVYPAWVPLRVYSEDVYKQEVFG